MSMQHDGPVSFLSEFLTGCQTHLLRSIYFVLALLSLGSSRELLLVLGIDVFYNEET